VRLAEAGDRTERGQALVEFAFTFPMLLVLMFAVIDFGRASFTYTSLASGTAEMARQMSIPATDNTHAIAAFNNGNVAMAGSNPATDKVIVTVYDAHNAQQGTQTCSLPLRASTCTMPARVNGVGAAYLGGYVVVTATSTFVFIPPLRGPLGIGYYEPKVTLQATALAYIG